MSKKVLLVSLTTVRDGERVRFEAGKTVNLTADEIRDLDKLTVSTGKPHYRDPVNESATADGPDELSGEQGHTFVGEDIPVAKKTVDQLRAYLDHHQIEYAADAQKPDLLKAATAFEADGGL